MYGNMNNRGPIPNPAMGYQGYGYRNEGGQVDQTKVQQVVAAAEAGQIPLEQAAQLLMQLGIPQETVMQFAQELQASQAANAGPLSQAGAAQQPGGEELVLNNQPAPERAPPPPSPEELVAQQVQKEVQGNPGPKLPSEYHNYGGMSGTPLVPPMSAMAMKAFGLG